MVKSGNGTKVMLAAQRIAHQTGTVFDVEIIEAQTKSQQRGSLVRNDQEMNCRAVAIDL
jgi:hypothetical protein